MCLYYIVKKENVMKHSSQIQIEFVKNAAWQDYSEQQQELYLRQHQKSKLRPTTHNSEKCRNCGHNLKVKDHGTWEGYHCPNCGAGGSRNKKKHLQNKRWRQQFNRDFPKSPNTTPVKSDFQKTIDDQFTDTVDIRPEFYNKATRTFSFELSDVDIGNASKVIILRNPKTNAKEKFTQYKVDKDSTNEDTYGWHYKSENGKYNLLIIND